MPDRHAPARARVPARVGADRRGATLVLVVLCLVPLLGIAALAVDVGVLFRVRRNAQTAADAAALAYAYERFRDPNQAGAFTNPVGALRAEAAANGYTSGVNRASVSHAVINWDGGTGNAVRVTVHDTVPALFAGVFGRNRTVVRASAAAAWSLAPAACLHVLDPSTNKALSVNSNGRLDTSGCDVVVNSSHGTAVELNSNASVTLGAGVMSIAGGFRQLGNSTISKAPTTGAMPTPNPFATAAAPTPPGGCTYTSKVVGANNTETLGPGTYCGGLTVRSNASVTFSPGQYYLLGGGFRAESNTRLQSAAGGVTFVNTVRAGSTLTNTLGAIDMDANATLDLRAATTGAGTLNGVLFYQDPAPATQPDLGLGANAALTMHGTIVAPKAAFNLSANGKLTVVGVVVVDRLSIDGNGWLHVPDATAATAGYYAGRRVTLVD